MNEAELNFLLVIDIKTPCDNPKTPHSCYLLPKTLPLNFPFTLFHISLTDWYPITSYRTGEIKCRLRSVYRTLLATSSIEPTNFLSKTCLLMYVLFRKFRLGALNAIVTPREAIARQLLKIDKELGMILHVKLVKVTKGVIANADIADQIIETALEELQAMSTL